MTNTSKKLTISKKHLSALMLCLSTSMLFNNDPCFSAGKRERDNNSFLHEGDDSESVISQHIRKRRVDDYETAFTKIFHRSLNDLETAEREGNEELRKSGLDNLKSVADRGYHAEAQHLYGLALKQGAPFFEEPDLESAINYFGKAFDNKNQSLDAPCRATYNKGLCWKKEGEPENAKVMFTIFPKHMPSKAQYGILLYNESEQNNTSESPTLKLQAIQALETAKIEPEAAYKLGLIYKDDEDVKNFDKALKMFSYAETNLKTKVNSDEYGFNDFDLADAEKNERKKCKAAFYHADIKWNKLKQDHGGNLQSYLNEHRADSEVILDQLRRAKSLNTKIKNQAIALETEINNSLPTKVSIVKPWTWF